MSGTYLIHPAYVTESLYDEIVERGYVEAYNDAYGYLAKNLKIGDDLMICKTVFAEFGPITTWGMKARVTAIHKGVPDENMARIEFRRIERWSDP